MIVFDIETGPLSHETLRERSKPFEAPPAPGEFDPATVKLGMLKDPDKIKAKLDEARNKHAASVASFETDLAAAHEQWWREIVSRAALSPLTGRVVAIGYLSTDRGVAILDIATEESMVRNFWAQYKKCRVANRKMVGHNIALFDVPFLMRRSWLLGIDVPPGVLEHGRYLDKTFIDTMAVWACGNRDMVSLDVLARSFGVGGKPDGITGAMFAELLKTDRATAEKYLRNDLDMTAGVAGYMGVL